MKVLTVFLIIIGSFNAFSQEKTMGKVIRSQALDNGYFNLCKSNSDICQLSNIQSYQIGTPCLCSDATDEDYVDTYFDDNDNSSEESVAVQ